MSNLIINRPVNQQFVQYPYWIAQGKEFSLDEVGLLAMILSFKDYLSKESLVNFTSDGKRAINTAWKGLIYDFIKFFSSNAIVRRKSAICESLSIIIFCNNSFSLDVSTETIFFFPLLFLTVTI
jgi:hypothetical protein